MKFPEVPGKTPREQFENLVRQVISVPKQTTKKKPPMARRGITKKALVGKARDGT